MALNKEHRNLPFLFGAGVVCLLYGLGFSYIEGRFTKPAVIVSLIGLACILICLFTLKMLPKRPGKVFQWKKYGFTATVIVSLAGLFAGVNYLSHRYNFRWDLTRARQHTLTENTTAFIKGLKQEVEITAFYVGLAPKYLEDFLKEYERLSQGKIKTEIVDPIVQIAYAAQFGSVISGKERKVIVRSGSERQDIDFTNEPLTEEQLTNAVIRVARDKRIIYFLTGHGEYDTFNEDGNGLSAWKELLTANNVVTRELMLGIKQEVPDDCNVLIVAGPRNPLTAEEEQIIQTYLEAGGDALFLIENTPLTTPERALTEEEKRKNPSLNSILNHWGIKIADDIVVDLSSHVSTDVGCPATRNYMPHSGILRNLDYTFYIRPRSISILEDRHELIRAAPLVLTASEGNSWGETDRTLQVKFDEGIDRAGPVPIAVVISKPKEEGKTSDTRIIVFTDADFLTNGFVDRYSNGEMGLYVINWLSELEDQVFIDRRDIKVERLDLTSGERRTVAVVLFAMPVLIAACGIMVWIRQRN